MFENFWKFLKSSTDFCVFNNFEVLDAVFTVITMENGKFRVIKQSNFV